MKKIFIILFLLFFIGCTGSGVNLKFSKTTITEIPATDNEPAKKITTIDEATYDRSMWVNQQIEGASFQQDKDGVIYFSITGQQSESTALIKAMDTVTQTNQLVKEVLLKQP